jgi:hypothetical protein
MLKLAALMVTALALLAMALIPAVSQAPPQAPRVQTNQQPKSATESQGAPTQKQNSANDPITVIPAIPPANLKEKASNTGSHGNENGTEYWPWLLLGLKLKVTDSLLALFTGLLIFVGAWQGGHLRATVKAIISGERPYIYPGVFSTARLLPSGAHAVYPLAANVPFPEIDWSFMNVGITPGIIKEIRGELFLGNALPRRPTFTYSRILRAELITHNGQETAKMTFPFNRNLTLDEIATIGAGHIQFCFFGYVKYTDCFRRLHTKGFSFRVRVRPQELAEPVGGLKYNYSKSQKIPSRYDT